MADSQKQAVIRFFRAVAQVQREEGIQIDGGDPKFRALCNSPGLVSMSDEELRERARSLFVAVSDDPEDARREAERRERLRERVEELAPLVAEELEAEDARRLARVNADDVLDATDSVC